MWALNRRLASTVALSALLLGCGNPVPPQAADPKRFALLEAYELMDRRETGRALVLLEGVLGQEPSNREARLLLASAYLGQAGIDVLSVHAAYSDVLFSKSLLETFKLSGDSRSPSEDTAVSPNRASRLMPGERMMERLDRALNTLRRCLALLNRLPRVPDRNWSLLDQALGHLDRLPPEKEVRVYRLFVRVVYFKEVLAQGILRDPDLGTREWACQLDLENLREGSIWAMNLLSRAAEDFAVLYPGSSSPFIEAHALFRELRDEMEHARQNAPVGAESGLEASQRSLRQTLKCQDRGRD